MSAAKAKKKDAKSVTPHQMERFYNILRRPLVTEKSTMGSEHGKISFVVANDASKPEIKGAVEAIFDVKVKRVNTMIHKGKTKFFRGRKGFRSDMKKAVITLEDGQNIDIDTMA